MVFEHCWKVMHHCVKSFQPNYLAMARNSKVWILTGDWRFKIILTLSLSIPFTPWKQMRGLSLKVLSWLRTKGLKERQLKWDIVNMEDDCWFHFQFDTDLLAWFVDILRDILGLVRSILKHSACTAIPELSTLPTCPSDNLQRHLDKTFKSRTFFEVETEDGFV